MYATSIFQPPPGEQIFMCDDHTSPLTQAYARTNETATALTFSCSGALSAEVWACLESLELPLFHQSADTISITMGLERIDAIVFVLDALKNKHFISAEFAQKIVDQYPGSFGGVMQWSSPVSFVPTLSLAAIEAESTLGSLEYPNPGTDLRMDISYFTDEDETPEQDTKRSKCNS